MNAALQALETPARMVAVIAINALWEDALILVAVALVLRLWPRLSAATRYTTWFVALIAALAAPIATTLSLHATSVRAVTRFAATHDVALSHGGPSTSAAARPALGMIGRHAESAVTGGTLGETSAAPDVARPEIILSSAAAFAIALLCVLASLVVLVRLVAGLLRLETLKRNALPLPLAYRDALRQDSRHGRDVRFCVSDETDVPVAIGLFDSMVLIPRHLLESMSPSELEQVCLHERGHLRRADDWTNLLQRVLVALLCFSPAVYAIARGLDLEREVACDDDVVAETGAIRPYAQCLTRMAELTAWPHDALAAPGVFVTRRGISERVERLLRAGRNAARGLALAPTAAAIALLAMLTLGMGLIAPTIAAPAVPHVAMPGSWREAFHGNARTDVALAPTPTGTPRVISIPARHVHVPAKHIDIPPKHIHVRGYDVNVPPVHVNVPGVHVHVPAIDVNVPGVNVEVPPVNVDVPAMHFTVPNYSGYVHSPTCTAGCDFSGVDWRERNLSGRRYSGADFSDAELSGADFSRDTLSAVDFSAADLRNADFTDAKLEYVDFSDARLAGARFDGATIDVCDFSGVDMRHVDLSRAHLGSLCRDTIQPRGDGL